LDGSPSGANRRESELSRLRAWRLAELLRRAMTPFIKWTLIIGVPVIAILGIYHFAIQH